MTSAQNELTTSTAAVTMSPTASRSTNRRKTKVKYSKFRTTTERAMIELDSELNNYRFSNDEEEKDNEEINEIIEKIADLLKTDV